MKTNYPAVPTTFSQDNQGRTTVALKNMEVYDGGSVPLDFAIQDDMKKTIEKILGSLPKKEENIIRKRFGIGVDLPQTLEEVGSELKVTRERIRQIEVKAIRKLKHPSRSGHLKAFLEAR